MVDGADVDGFKGDVGEDVTGKCDRLIFFVGGGCDASDVFVTLEGGER